MLNAWPQTPPNSPPASGRPDPDFWQGRHVFVTGHTGFAGGWLCFWLAHWGARVTGFGLPPSARPNFFDTVDLASDMTSVFGDVRDAAALTEALRAARPDIVLHLAGQPILRQAMKAPADTFAINVGGTVNLLEAARQTGQARAVVLLTADKVYRDSDGAPRRETDPLGGQEPYGLSKACAEYAAEAWRACGYANDGGPIGLATARAGKLVGGGDWSPHRFVPDAVRAFEAGDPLVLRNPRAVRPWHHVADAVRGLLMLAEHLHRDAAAFSQPFNFGPPPAQGLTVADVADRMAKAWGHPAIWRAEAGVLPQPDAQVTELDSSLAASALGWRARWGIDRAIAETIKWYRGYNDCRDLRALTRAQIDAHMMELAGQSDHR